MGIRPLSEDDPLAWRDRVPAAIVLLGIAVREVMARDELEQRIRLTALAV